ncbi:MAG: hypothetical protein PWP34_2355 [Desulfuromonadales bacterium]|nr:hypothetical protein [Desulfuromonadales bacterium]
MEKARGIFSIKKASELLAGLLSSLERETGFEPATFSLGS